MKAVFADAFFYIALLNRRDAGHRRAMDVLVLGGIKTVTTTAVLLEVADAMTAPVWRGVCTTFLEELPKQSGTSVRSLDEDLWKRGLELYGSRSDKEWSLTDCISFVVMKDEGLEEALTGVRHFEQAGFKALLVGK